MGRTDEGDRVGVKTPHLVDDLVDIDGRVFGKCIGCDDAHHREAGVCISIDVSAQLLRALARSDLNDAVDCDTIAESTAQRLARNPASEQGQQRGQRDRDQHQATREVGSKHVGRKADEREDPDRRVAHAPVLLGPGSQVATGVRAAQQHGHDPEGREGRRNRGVRQPVVQPLGRGAEDGERGDRHGEGGDHRIENDQEGDPSPHRHALRTGFDAGIDARRPERGRRGVGLPHQLNVLGAIHLGFRRLVKLDRDAMSPPSATRSPACHGTLRGRFKISGTGAQSI